MNEIINFSKNYGSIFSIIIAIIGVSLGFFYHLKGRKLKMLEYVITSKTPLFNQLHSKMKIYFDNQEIKEDACLSILTIKNIGNEPVKEEEFEKKKPLKINLLRHDGAAASIFDVEIYSSNPLDFSIEFDYTNQEGTISIQPILFNSKDYISLKLISTEFEKVSASGRIVGGSIVNGEKRIKRKGLQAFSIGFVIGVIISILILLTGLYLIGVSLSLMINIFGFILALGVLINFILKIKKDK